MKFPTTRENSTKDKIILVLSTEKYISMRKLYNILRSRYSLSVTYHAVYKTINHMVKDKTIEKHSKQYNISHSWITETKNFLEKMEKCETVNVPPPEKLFAGELNTVTFNSQFNFFNYMIDFFTLFAHNGDRKFYGRFYHLYWALSFEGDKFVKFKNMINSFTVGYLLCNASSQADKIISDYYYSVAQILGSSS